MSSRVRVLSITHVHPAQTTDASRPPPHAADHKLSFLDVIYVAKIPIQRLLFFDGPDLPPFPSVVSTLKSSLAATLAVFLPLAGELTYRPTPDEVVIDCSPGAVSSGVKFVVAEYSGGADDMRRLASDDEHDTEAFMQLVPELDVKQLPAPVLAVQVTRSAAAGNGGGDAVAVGVSMLHAVADGQAVWNFIRAWSTASREGSLAAPGLVPPTFDRTAIRHPKAEELYRTFLRFFAPARPLLRPPSSSSTLDITQQSRRTFLLSADQIHSLKQHISQSGAVNGWPSKPPTTYVAVSSLVWTSIVRAKSLNHADDAHFMVSADCRRRLRPPLGEGFFGNCIKPCFARANAGDLCGEVDGLARAAAAIQSAIRENLEEVEDPLSDLDRLLEVYGGIPKERFAAVGSSHRFMAYETDFGWGAPSRVELVSMFMREMVTLLGARGGGVQVSVTLDRALMEAFMANFVVPTSKGSG